MKVFLLIFFLISIFSKIILSEIPDRYFIETYLLDSTQKLMDKELKLKKSLNASFSLVKVCSSNLNASNISTNFISVLDKYYAEIQKIQTMSDHEIVRFTFGNATLYDYAQMRFSTISSDVKKLQIIKANLQKNATTLYKFSQDVTKQYLSNYKIISTMKSKNKLVNTVIRNILAIGTAIGSYIQQLNIHIGNSVKLTSYLTKLITSKVVAPPAGVTQGAFITKLQAEESKLIAAQQQTITSAKVALRKVLAAQRSVASEKKVQSGIGDIFASVINTLNECAKANEYSRLGWPAFPDLSDIADENERAADHSMKVIITENKGKSYANSQNKAKQQKENLKMQREALSASVKSSRSVQAPSIAFADALVAIMNSENSMNNYVGKLDNASSAILKLKANLEKPCGTFLQYDTMNDIKGPELNGFQGGIHFVDGKTRLYVGYGYSGCGQSMSPGYIITNSSAPGCYMACGGLYYDKSQVYYLVAHPKLTWVPTDLKAMYNVPGTLKISDGRWPFMFGRILYKGFYTLGKIHHTTESSFYIQNEETSIPFTTGFEILACSP